MTLLKKMHFGSCSPSEFFFWPWSCVIGVLPVRCVHCNEFLCFHPTFLSLDLDLSSRKYVNALTLTSARAMCDCVEVQVLDIRMGDLILHNKNMKELLFLEIHLMAAFRHTKRIKIYKKVRASIYNERNTLIS